MTKRIFASWSLASSRMTATRRAQRETGTKPWVRCANAGQHWSNKGLKLKPGLIVYQYLEPIPPGLKRAEFMRLLQDRIETASTALLSP